MRAERDHGDHGRPLANPGQVNGFAWFDARGRRIRGLASSLLLEAGMNQRGNTMSKQIAPSIPVTLLAALASLQASGCPLSSTTPPDPEISGRSGVANNAITMNALTTNALTTHPERLRELIESPLVDDSFKPGSSLGDALWDPSAQQVMEYLVSCALEPGQRLSWPPPSSPGPPLAPMTWEGSLGLCPRWGQAAGGVAGDAACQELVSACLLARNNAFGMPVQISLRGFDTSDEYFGAGNVLENDVLTPEHEVYHWREGAFYGNIFDPAALDPRLLVGVVHDAASGAVTVSYWHGNATNLTEQSVFQMNVSDYATVGREVLIQMRNEAHDRFMREQWQGGQIVTYGKAFACWSPEWTEVDAYFRRRLCAGSPGAEHCLARAVGACREGGMAPADPAFLCTVEHAPDMGYWDFDDCVENATSSSWSYPITVFLREACDVVREQESCYRTDQQGTGVYLAEHRRFEQP
jgi:hypothetical protein